MKLLMKHETDTETMWTSSVTVASFVRIVGCTT